MHVAQRIVARAPRAARVMRFRERQVGHREQQDVGDAEHVQDRPPAEVDRELGAEDGCQRGRERHRHEQHGEAADGIAAGDVVARDRAADDHAGAAAQGLRHALDDEDLERAGERGRDGGERIKAQAAEHARAAGRSDRTAARRRAGRRASPTMYSVIVSCTAPIGRLEVRGHGRQRGHEDVDRQGPGDGDPHEQRERRRPAPQRRVESVHCGYYRLRRVMRRRDAWRESAGDPE